MTKNTSIAKIATPVPGEILERERLYDLLDKRSPVSWISSPGGSGKTTLTASYLRSRNIPHIWYRLDDGDGDIATFFHYLGLAAKKAAPRRKTPLPHLTPEFMTGMLTFTKRFFEKLYSTLKTPAVIIFDDYQEVSAAPEFHDIINAGLSVLPDGISVIVMSRVNPPEVFSRLRLNRRLSIIGWESLRLNVEETGIIGRLIKPSAMESHLPEEVLQKTGGWLAGLILMLESIKEDKLSDITLKDDTPEAIFGYFAHEVYSRADERIKSILLRTAFVSSFTSQMLEGLAGKGSSKYGISNLVKGNFFIEVHGSSKKEYRYHPLFREFLLTVADETFSKDELAEIRDLSSQALLSEGRFDEAADFLIKIQAWDKLSATILTHAEELFVQGRLTLLKSWISYLPQRIKDGQPWLIYWEGLCLIPFDQTASRNILSNAFSRFDVLKDETGLITSWSAIIETHIVDFSKIKTIDKWLKIFNEEIEPILERQEENSKVAAISAYLHALFWRLPASGDIRKWRKIAEEAIYKSSSPGNIMRLAGALLQPISFTEKLHEGRRLINYMEQNVESKSTDPVMIIQYYAMKAMYSGHVGDHVNGMAAFEEGSKIIKDTGIHSFDQMLFLYYAHNVVASGDKKKLRSALVQLKNIPAPRLLDQAHVDYSSGTILLALDDARGAEVCAEKAFEFTKKTGAPVSAGVTMLALGTIKCRLGKYDESLAWFTRARKLAGQFNMISFHSLIYQGFLYFEKGEKNKGIALLREGLAIGAKERYIMMPYFDRPFMNRIFSLAIEMEIEKDYTREFIRKNRLLPVHYKSSLKNWPWPVKVYTLGSFRIELDGTPLEEGRKSHHRLLNLLNAIICLGGADVPSHRLADSLWPEQDGDAAQSALDMGIHRLRKLLNFPEAIEVKHGAVSLNPHICWVDALAFDGLVKSYRKKNDEMTRPIDIENILSLYGGKFLPAHSDSEWIIAMRENLESSYLKLLERLGSIHEEAKGWDEALECYRRGVKDNPLSEEHVRGLMRAFTVLNRPTDAILAYEKFAEELENTMGIDPSPATKSLLKEISSSS